MLTHIFLRAPIYTPRYQCMFLHSNLDFLNRHLFPSYVLKSFDVRLENVSFLALDDV